MRGHVGLLVVLVVTVSALVVMPATVAEPSQSEPDPEFSQSEPHAEFVQTEEIDADEVRMDVELRSDGSADWTVEFWVRLDDDESEAAFESLRDDVEDDPDAYTESFAARMDETVAAASDATGREMAAEEFSVSAERQSFAREYGVVRYTFVWHGFAAAEGDELHAGDAVEGIYLDDGTRLLIGWPEEYELVSATPDPDDERDHAVVWRGGETDFVSGEPRVVVAPSGWGSSMLILAGGIGVAGVAAVAAAWWYRDRRAAGARSRDDDPEPAAEEATDADGESSVESGNGESLAVASSSGSASAPSQELLSNEEQVLALLEERGGRMKQQTVVEELGWTDAKTSKVVSKLREDGEVESFRLGRENVLSLPEEDPKGADE